MTTNRELVTFIVDHFESLPGTDPMRGFIDDPDDRGGATNWGVTQARLAMWRGRAVTRNEVKALTREEAIEILLMHYLYEPHFNTISDVRLRFAVVDYGIHSGPRVAAKALQKAVGARADGDVGQKTQAAVAAANAAHVRERVIGARIRLIGWLVRRRPTQVRFIEGWANRVAAVLEATWRSSAA